MKVIWLLLFVLFVTGCGSIQVRDEPVWETSEKGFVEVLVYRTKGAHSKAVALYFGSINNYVAALKEREYVKLYLPTGNHVMRAGASKSNFTDLKIDLTDSDRECLKLYANPAWWSVAMIPILHNTVKAVNLENSECPDEQKLEEYKLVDGKI